MNFLDRWRATATEDFTFMTRLSEGKQNIQSTYSHFVRWRFLFCDLQKYILFKICVIWYFDYQLFWFSGGEIHTNIKQISGHNQVAAGSPDILGSQDIFKFPTPDFQTYNPGIFGISKKSLTTVFKYFSQSLTYRLKQLVLRPLITAEVSTITFQTFDYFK